MAGLGFALAGAVQGAGQGMIEQARQRREDALAALKRQQDVADMDRREALQREGWDRQESRQERGWQRDDRLASEERGRSEARIDRSARALGDIVFSDLTRADYRPEPGKLNVSMDFNAVDGGGATGTLVVIPDDATPETRAAAEEYNRRVVDFARENGIEGYSDRGVVTRSENGRGVPHTVHTEPFFNDDIAMQEAIKANPAAFAKIYAETFGTLPNARIIAAHGEGRDRGAASSVFGDETSYGEVIARAWLNASGEPNQDALRALSDPETAPQVREALADTLPKRRGLDPDAYSSIVWQNTGDGEQIRMGINDRTGRYEPVPGPDGEPVTQPRGGGNSSIKPRNLSASASNRFEAMLGEARVPPDMEARFMAEAERLLTENPEMTETQAMIATLDSANKTPDTTRTETRGLLPDREVPVPGTYDGTFGGRAAEPGGEIEDSPRLPEGVTLDAALEQARQAIAAGADEAKVLARLIEMGISPERL